MPTTVGPIAVANDRLRKTGQGGLIMITSGLAGLGDDMVAAARDAVAAFDDFNPDNDPWKEHDLGFIKIRGQRLMWKIDAYPVCDPITSVLGVPPEGDVVRVLTIMLADEY